MAGDQNQIVDRKPVAERCEDGSRQSLQPRNTGKHGDAHQERQRQPNNERTFALCGRKLVDQDGDEDQIINSSPPCSSVVAFNKRIRPPASEPLTIHEERSVLEVVEQLRGALVPMAIVNDGAGAIKGVVTSTDLLEALLGNGKQES